jgi:glycosyltransferase involved in cell wall biosynthesis
MPYAVPSVSKVSVDVILPCLDEAAALPWVLGRMPAGLRPMVVDNGSTDGSAEIAQRLGAEVVTAPVRGYGSACEVGLRRSTAEIVVMMDCDGSIDPRDLSALVDPVTIGEVDLVVGRRRAGRDLRAYPLHLRLANRSLAARLSRRTGIRLRDCGPVRVARRQVLLDLDLGDRRFGYPVEVVVKAVAAGRSVANIDIRYAPRVGRSKVTGTPRGIWRALRDASAALR